MNWLGAFRMCGGWLTETDIQRVRDALDYMGYETRAEDGGNGWITHLCRGSRMVWQYDRTRSDRMQQMSVIFALGSDHCSQLTTTFGMYVIDDFEVNDEEDVEEEDTPPWQQVAKPFVGAATRLPLPKERK